MICCLVVTVRAVTIIRWHQPRPLAVLLSNAHQPSVMSQFAPTWNKGSRSESESSTDESSSSSAVPPPDGRGRLTSSCSEGEDEGEGERGENRWISSSAQVPQLRATEQVMEATSSSSEEEQEHVGKGKRGQEGGPWGTVRSTSPRLPPKKKPRVANDVISRDSPNYSAVSLRMMVRRSHSSSALRITWVLFQLQCDSWPSSPHNYVWYWEVSALINEYVASHFH